MSKDLKQQAEELAAEMTANLARNDKNRDKVDEADFKRSLGAAPFQAKKKGPVDSPSPFGKGLVKAYQWNGQGGQRVKITSGEFAGRSGVVQGQIAQYGAIGTSHSRFGEPMYRVLIDGFPKPGGWNGITLVQASMLEKE